MFAASKTSKLAVAAPTTDPYFNYVSALINADGTNGAQNNTFVDSSANNYSITRGGDSTQGSFSPYGSLWSNYFDGQNDQLRFSNAVGVAGSAFTICFWFCPLSSSVIGLFDSGPGSTNGFRNYPANSIQDQNDGTVSFAGSYFVNQWNWMCITKSGTSFTVYVNGNSVGSAVCSATMLDSSFTIGTINTGADGSYNGYIADFQVLSAAFNLQPPSAPSTVNAYTNILTCNSNRFVDKSTNNYAIAISGNPSVERFSPFKLGSEYNSATMGASGFFGFPSGSISNVSLSPTALSSVSVYTIEFWAYNFAAAWPDQTILGPWTPNLIRESSGQLQIYLAGSNKFNTTWVRSQWNHVALANDATSLRLYINGVLINSTSSQSINLSSIIVASQATNSSGNDRWNGYISDFRVLNGTALYTGSTYTVPTAPLTAITNTAVLLNFKNGAIIDAAMQNDFATAGSAQISTSIKKYGTGSVSLNGTNSYLISLYQSSQLMGSGNFTIEGWIYPTASTGFAFRPILASSLFNVTGNSDLQYHLYLDASGYITFKCFSGTTAYTVFQGTGVTLNTWTYVAVVRNGVNLTLYVNGTSVSTIATLSTLSLNSSTSFTLRYGGYVQSSTFYYFAGNLDEFRVTKGIARYTTNFTPPVSAFPNY